MTNESISFSIENWNKYVLLLETHRLETRNGRSARIVCYDRISPFYPIVALLDIGKSEEYMMSMKTNGGANITDTESVYDLMIVPIPPKSLGWIVVYESKTSGRTHSSMFDSEGEARRAAAEQSSPQRFYKVLSITEVFANV